MTLSTLDFATLTILSKQVAAAQKTARKSVEPGSLKCGGQVLADVSGSVNVGEDYESRIVLKADPFLMLKVALSKLNGVTVASIVAEALSLDKDAAAEVKDEAKAAWEAINSTTLTDCKGKVTVVKGAKATVGVPRLVNS